MQGKVVSRALLAKILNRSRSQKKVVFTNGCFDILHAGHVTLLEQAKCLGDILIVGLNSDRSLKKLKGKGRPLVRQKERAKVLSALSSVDYVTIFGEETPETTIRILKPDILVKGNDYALSQIAGRQFVKKVVRVPLLKGLSTTGLIRKILKCYGA